MDNLVTKVKNTSIYEINFDEKFYSEFKKKLFGVLKKFSTSRKTKAVHKLVDSNIIKLATFSGELATSLSASISSQQKLRAIMINVFLFDDSLDQHGAVQIAGEITQLQNKIQKEKTYLTDKQILNIEELNKQLDAKFEKLLNTLDYIKIIDGIYFEYLKFLTMIALESDQTAKPKIIAKTSDVLSALIKKMYLKVQRGIEPEMHQLIDAVSVYFILTYYFGESGPYALAKMKNAYKPEILELIKKTKVTRFKDFKELAYLIRELNIINITESVFETQLKKTYGKYAYENYIMGSLQNFIAVNANLSHSTQLFNAYPINDDMHLRLEELILNEQKKIVINAGNM